MPGRDGGPGGGGDLRVVERRGDSIRACHHGGDGREREGRTEDPLMVDYLSLNSGARWSAVIVVGRRAATLPAAMSPAPTLAPSSERE